MSNFSLCPTEASKMSNLSSSSSSLSSLQRNVNNNNNNTRKATTNNISLNPREIKRFVACYKKHELLWNTKCPQYTIPSARNEALRNIAIEMGKNWTETLVKSKWNQLKSQYRRELGKLSDTCPGGSEADTPPSRWWLFGLMDSFLRPHTTLRNGSTYVFPLESLKMEDVSPVASYEGVDDSQDGCIESGGSLDGCLEPEADSMLVMKEVSPSEHEEISCFSLSSDRNLTMIDMGNNSLANSTSNHSQGVVGGQTRDPDEMFSAWLHAELCQIDDEYIKDDLKIELMQKCNEAKRTCRLRKMQSVSHMNRTASLGAEHHISQSISPHLSSRSPLCPPQHSPHTTHINRTT